MKQHITLEYFKNDFGFSKVNEQNAKVEDDEITFYAQLATTYVDKNIVGGAVSKKLRDKEYLLSDDGKLSLAPGAVFADTELEQEKINAYEEAVAMMTKFGLDTGYDFITGSFSRGMGAENYAEVLDFQSSLQSLVETIKGQLANYEWTVTVASGSIKIGFDQGDEPEVGHGGGTIPGGDGYWTQQQMKSFHSAGHKAGDGIIIKADPVEDGVVVIEVDPKLIGGDLSVEDTEILATEAHITETEKAFDDDLNTEPGVA